MSARALSAGEMIERHPELFGIESQTGEYLLDADLVDIATTPLELLLYSSIAGQRLIPFDRVGHVSFEFFQFPLHADEVRERLEAYIPEHALQFEIGFL